MSNYDENQMPPYTFRWLLTDVINNEKLSVFIRGVAKNLSLHKDLDVI